MLASLHIENIAVIKSVDIDFSSGFSALTGETGAGKSIILDSINLLMGKKAEKELIRNSENTAMVSGLFTDISNHCLSRLQALGITPDDDGSILIQRSISRDGRSQSRINGRAVNSSVLKAVSAFLVNIHGQSDTHALMDESNHLPIIDMYANTADLLSEYSVLYSEYESIKREIKSISEKESERVRYIEMLEYQIADIDQLSLTDGEEESLIDKKLKLKNSERISKQAGFVYKALKGSEKGSVSFLLDRSVNALASLSDCIPEFSEFAEKLRDCLYQIDDIAEEVYAVLDESEIDPTEKLNEIESRLDKIAKIKRKYGLTVKDVLEFRDRAFSELEKMKNSDDLLKELQQKAKAAYEKALTIAKELHNSRLSHSKELEREVCGILQFLDMPKVTFIVSLKECFEAGEYKLTPSGIDRAELLISSNSGLEPKSIAKIASGGELARIMLALKSVIADKDGVLTIVFDEIDAGVSGKTARKIGIKMQALASSVQLFCVTHSAQIASLADTHYLISKTEVGANTETSITALDDEGRINELSRILGGINVTAAQRGAAMDMLRERKEYSGA
jgi:DNA repair protein RecN (Recombination protein N)